MHRAVVKTTFGAVRNKFHNGFVQNTPKPELNAYWTTGVSRNLARCLSTGNRTLISGGRDSKTGSRSLASIVTDGTTGNRPAISGRSYSHSGSSQELPAGAEVVVCGAGVVGASVAYHLAERGVKDVVVLEQGSVGGGTTWHSAAMTISLREHPTMAALTNYTVDLCREFEKLDYGAGFKECGSMNICRTQSRVSSYKRNMSTLRACGGQAEFITPDRVAEIVPWVKTDDLLGAVYIPTDGGVSPTDLAAVFIKRAKERGVRSYEKCEVQRVVTDGRKVTGVETDKGNITCKYFVNAAGMWGRELGRKSKPEVDVPAHACEHFYIVTKPLEGVDIMAPVVRDYDGYVYFREWSGGLLAGGFEPKALPCFHEGVPKGFEFQLLHENWDQFQILWDEIVHRVPMIEHAEIRSFVNGPESFTPDSAYLLGPAPNVENYYLSCGMSSLGMVGSGGVGRAIAEYITEGRTSLDFTDFDPRRFGSIHMDPEFLSSRASEILAVFGAAIPASEVVFKEGRNQRLSPLHHLLQAAGAVCTPTMGWERVSYFSSNQDDVTAEVKDAFGRPSWFGNLKQEVEACTSGVGLFDASSMVVVDVESEDGSALQYLQNLCYSDVNIATNVTMETGLLNHLGQVEAQCYVTRNHDNRFTLLATPDLETRLLAWLHRHLSPGGAVSIKDRTGLNTVLQLIGPKSTSLVDELKLQGRAVVKLPHVYENYFVIVPEKQESVKVFDWLRSQPEVTLIGYDATRYNAAYHVEPTWGVDVTPHHRITAWGKWANNASKDKTFTGSAALTSSAPSGVSLVQLQVTPPADQWIWGHEPVYAQGATVASGWTTSAQYDFRNNVFLVWAIIENLQQATSGVELVVAASRIPAKINHVV